MARARLAFGLSVLFGLVGASALSAQDLSEVCPNADESTGALWGTVSEPDAGMILPGATVRATWEDNGIPGRAETQTGLDGSFTMCYLPLETELSVQAMIGTMAGQIITVTLTEPITQLDVSFSMTGGDAVAEDDRIWACFPGGVDSRINLLNSRLIRCDVQWKPLRQCPQELLGMVTARGVGAGSGMIREMLETLTTEAKRLGANALVNISGSRGSITAEAVKIEVDPSTC